MGSDLQMLTNLLVLKGIHTTGFKISSLPLRLLPKRQSQRTGSFTRQLSVVVKDVDVHGVIYYGSYPGFKLFWSFMILCIYTITLHPVLNHEFLRTFQSM